MQPRKRQFGRSLVETVIATSLGAVVVTMTAGACLNTLRDMRLSETTNELLRDIQRARILAINGARPVGVCASADGRTCIKGAGPDDWSRGWMAYVAKPQLAGADAGQEILFASIPAAAVGVRLESPQPDAGLLLRPIGSVATRANVAASFSIYSTALDASDRTNSMRCVSLADGLRTVSFRARDHGGACRQVQQLQVAERS
jgi:hypothetical protein